jgi:hypothetical protein
MSQTVYDQAGRARGFSYWGENSHYMDESEHCTLGEFNTLETAIAACRKIVDNDLDHSFKFGDDRKQCSVTPGRLPAA